MKGMESNNKPPNKNMSINDMSDEIWVLLSNYKKGLNDKFMVSNLGRVKDVDRFVRNGKTGKRFIKSKIMPQANDGRGTIGYMRVSLSDNKRSVSILVHKLVAHCFIGDIPNGYHINHKDFNTHNNNVLNLEIVTREQNIKHYQDNLLEKMNKGEVVSNYRFSKNQIIDIYNSKLKMAEISKMYNVNWKTIKDIKLKYTFKEITKDLPDNKPRRERLSVNIILDIYNNKHLPAKVMMRKYKLSESAVMAVRSGRRHSKITGHKYGFNQ